MKQLTITIILVFTWVFASAQLIKNRGIPIFIHNYVADDYNAGRQNFSILQDYRGLMYFANADAAVLTFDGARWRRIAVPNTVVLSLAQGRNDTIFVGAKNQFGLLQRTPSGDLRFKSLKPLLPKQIQSFGPVWQVEINPVDSSVIYLTGMHLFIYKNGRIKVIKVDSISHKSLFLRLFKVYNKIYVSVKYRGLYTIEPKGLKFVPHSDTLWVAMAMLPYPKHQIFIVSFFQGGFLYNFHEFRHITTPIDSFLIRKVYRAIDIRNRYYAFALIPGGVLITDYMFEPVQFINSQKGLYNDKVLNMYLDRGGNLWLALDNGISSVALFSPFTEFNQFYGFSKSTKVFSTCLLHDTLYIANSDGLYYLPWDRLSPLEHYKFKPVKNIDQKTYLIRKVGNSVIGACDLGLYQVRGGKAHFITQERQIMYFIQLRSDSNVIIGVKNSLSLFKRDKHGNWHFMRIIEGSAYPMRYIVEDKHGFLWASDVTSGIYKIFLTKNLDSVRKIIFYDSEHGLHGLPSQYGNHVFDLHGKVVFGTQKGFYRYDYQIDSFVPIRQWNKKLRQLAPISFAMEDSYGNIWFKQELEGNVKKNWMLGELQKVPNGYKLIMNLFYPFKNKIFSFGQITPYIYIIGSEGGFIDYDVRYLWKPKQQFRAYISEVRIVPADSVIYYGYADEPERNYPVIAHRFNDLRFVFGADFYTDPSHVLYNYYLNGYDKSWLGWSKIKMKEYSNLPAGTYTFYVKAKNLFGQQSKVAKFTFVVKPPWYLTVWAIIMYFILGGLFVWLVVYLYTLRLRKQKEYLEEQVRLRTIEIQEQKAEIEQQRDLLAKQNEEIMRKNKDITDSIEYAKRIQEAILPMEKTIKRYLPESFILFKPRDIVSGDFYWFAYVKGKIIIAAVDCTGHGVPGAFMSMIGVEILNTIVLNKGVTDPAEILTLQNLSIRQALKQDRTDNQDGMDMALCVIDKQQGIVEFAGAKNPLIYIDNQHNLHKIRGDRQSIGGYQYEPGFRFTKHVIEIRPPMWFYIFSDGYQDQFGGEGPRKFMTKIFYNLLHQIHTLPMDEQKHVLEQTLEDWKDGYSQTDDILVIGFKL